MIRKIFTIKFIFASLLILFFSGERVYSQIFTLYGQVFKYRYAGINIDGIGVSLEGPLDPGTHSPAAGYQYRYQQSVSVLGHPVSQYFFSGLVNGHYHLKFRANNTFGSFYNHSYQSGDGVQFPQTSPDSTDPINIDISGSDIDMDTIFAAGRLYNISGYVDTTGIFGAGRIPGVWLRLNMTNYGGVSDTIWVQTDGSGNYTFNNIDAAGNWTLRTRNDNPGTGNQSYTGYNLSTPSSGQRTYLNITGNQTSQSFRFSIINYNLGGNIRFLGTTSLSGIQVNLNGPTGTSGTTTTNGSGYYQFNKPCNYYYTEYSMTPVSTVYDFIPATITKYPLTSNSTDNDFYAVFKKFTISGQCYIGPVTTAPNVKIYIDSFRVSDDEYQIVDSMYTDITGTYSTLKSATGTYRIRPVDTSSSPILYYPQEKVIVNLMSNQAHSFYSSACGPILFSPSNGAKNIPIVPVLTWKPPLSGPPASYTIQVSENPTFPDFVGGSNITIPHVGGENDLQTWAVTVPLNFGVTYYWRVMTDAADGNKISDIWSFQTSLGPPTLITPPDSSQTGTKPFYSWLSVIGATSYDIEVKQESSGLTGIPTQTDITATNFQQPTNLVPFKWYIWSVRAKNASSISAWATRFHFYTGLLTPVLKSPANGANNQPSNLTLRWFGVPGATQYILQYSTDSNFIYNTITLDVADTNRSVLGLMVDSCYYWRVKVKLPSETGWSETWHFYIDRIFSWWPTQIDFGQLLLNRFASAEVTFFNDGDGEVILSNVGITDTINYTCQNRNDFPFTIPPHSTKKVYINFSPKSIGMKNAWLKVHHNVSTEPQNPALITLLGEGVRTFATIEFPEILDFGTVVLNTGLKTKEITITNNSPVAGDILNIDQSFFEMPNGNFTVLTPLPASLLPGQSMKITIGLNTDKLGIFTNNLHLPNSSSNISDAVIKIKGRIVVGGLIVEPTSIDFGKTSINEPFKKQKITIWNASTRVITVFDKYLLGDTSSYSFTINKPFPIALKPNQIDTVEVMFFPATSGRKNAQFAVKSDDSLAPLIYVPITGLAGDQPILWTNMQEIDFGSLRSGHYKDTVLIVKNIGSIDLKIDSKTIFGDNSNLFTFINDGHPIILRAGESEEIIIRFSAQIPFGRKKAEMEIKSNDPDKPQYYIKMFGRVQPGYILKNTDRIVFDTLNIGYSQDTTFILWNEGEITAVIDNIFIDGPEAVSFLVDSLTMPITIKPGDTLKVHLKFKPKLIGSNAARIVIHSNDPIEPTHQIMLLGWGKEPIPEIGIAGNGRYEGEEELYFGRVPIFYSGFAYLGIRNLSKFSGLRIDTIYFDPIDNQPFSHVGVKFPLFIKGGKTDSVLLKFNPRDRIRSYKGYVNIIYNDSVQTKKSDKIKKLRVRGDVIFPDVELGLDPVLEVGKVLKDSSKTVFFLFRNKGEHILDVDSMVLEGDDKEEFVIHKTYPFKVQQDTIDTCFVTFKPKRIGSKDARIIIYTNDLFKSCMVKIWAECIMNPYMTSVKNNVVPANYALDQNYPNPFNPSTKIGYSIPEMTRVIIKIYNSLGVEIETLVDALQQAGNYVLTWNSNKYPSGTYFYRIQTSKFTAMKKMLFLK